MREKLPPHDGLGYLQQEPHEESRMPECECGRSADAYYKSRWYCIGCLLHLFADSLDVIESETLAEPLRDQWAKDELKADVRTSDRYLEALVLTVKTNYTNDIEITIPVEMLEKIEDQLKKGESERNVKYVKTK